MGGTYSRLRGRRAAKRVAAGGVEERPPVKPRAKYKPAKAVVVRPTRRARAQKSPEEELADAEMRLSVRPRDRRALLKAARLRFAFRRYDGAIEAADALAAQGVEEPDLQLVLLRSHAAKWRELRHLARRPAAVTRAAMEDHLRRARASARAVLAVAFKLEERRHRPSSGPDW